MTPCDASALCSCKNITDDFYAGYLYAFQIVTILYMSVLKKTQTILQKLHNKRTIKGNILVGQNLSITTGLDVPVHVAFSSS